MTNGHNGHLAPPILLSIAGFDPSCGAGTAADLKTFAAHGCYGIAAITSLTVQNTQQVETVHNTPSAELRAQLEALARDCDIAGVKIGMLGNRGNAAAAAEFLDAHKFAHVVLDPVFTSSTGAELLDAAGIKFVSTELLKRVSVITPNIPEAEVLTGLTVKDLADMESAARKLVEMGAHAVIVKGGHLDRAVDILFEGGEMIHLAADRVKVDHTHGTGCAFSSALTAQLASGRSLFEAAALAKTYVTMAIEKGYPVGKGRVPLGYFSLSRCSSPPEPCSCRAWTCLPPTITSPTSAVGGASPISVTCARILPSSPLVFVVWVSCPEKPAAAGLWISASAGRTSSCFWV